MARVVYYCAGRDGHLWRDLWNVWRYSEVIEYANARSKAELNALEEIAGGKLKHHEQVVASLLLAILKRL